MNEKHEHRWRIVGEYGMLLVLSCSICPMTRMEIRQIACGEV